MTSFDQWFNEPEVFGTRGERIMDMESMQALRAVWDAAISSRPTLTPADSHPHSPCKSCGGTQIGEQDGNRIVSRCIQCRRKDEE